MKVGCKLPSGEAQCRKHYRTYQWCAKARGLTLDLTLDQFRVITKQPCHYCGQPPVPRIDKSTKRYNGPFVGNGIDRKDNSQGYSTQNCVSSCYACNYAKRDRTYDDYIAWVIRSAEHLVLRSVAN